MNFPAVFFRMSRYAHLFSGPLVPESDFTLLQSELEYSCISPMDIRNTPRMIGSIRYYQAHAYVISLKSCLEGSFRANKPEKDKGLSLLVAPHSSMVPGCASTAKEDIHPGDPP
jgi:hypothetical protein